MVRPCQSFCRSAFVLISRRATQAAEYTACEELMRCLSGLEQLPVSNSPRPRQSLVAFANRAKWVRRVENPEPE